MEDPVYGPQVKALFEKVDITAEDVLLALELIKKTDAVDRCLDLAREYAMSARSKIDSFPESVYKDSLYNLADYIVSRDR